MIFREFPDLQWLKKQAEDRFENRQGWGGRTLTTSGWPTVILNVPTKATFRDDIRGPLSVFTNLQGTSSVVCEKQRAVLRPGYFYLTNPDQRYTLDIDTTEQTETFNIHFGEYWAEQVLGTIIESTDKLLDEPLFATPPTGLGFYNTLYTKDAAFNALIEDLRVADDGLRREELLYDLLKLLLRQNNTIRKTEASIPLIKTSTRHEVLKRLMLATDYIHSYYHKDLTLDELAGVSCLSKFHFLRLFKVAFQKTPHQFINEVKVTQAKALLADHALEVNVIARKLGFTSASTFSRMFHQQTGLYPSQYR